MDKRKQLVVAIMFFIAILVFILAWQKDTIFSLINIAEKRKLYSQFNEELLIRDFFKDQRNGIFLDVGCNDYKNVSTTFYLEEKLGWKGIAVDALSEFAEGYLLHRPNTKFYNFIVTDHSGTVDPFYRLVNDNGRSSLNKNIMLEKAKKYNISTKYETVYIPTITLNELLEKNNILKIDFLSMDIEGSELLALAGFNIEKFRPELVCIETSRSASRKILDYFIKHNYERIGKYLLFDHLNWYFKPKSAGQKLSLPK